MINYSLWRCLQKQAATNIFKVKINYAISQPEKNEINSRQMRLLTLTFSFPVYSLILDCIQF